MVPSIGDENLFTRQKGDKGEKTQTSGLIDTFGSLPRILSSELLLFITIQTTTATTKHGTLKQAHLVALFSLSLSYLAIYFLPDGPGCPEKQLLNHNRARRYCHCDLEKRAVVSQACASQNTMMMVHMPCPLFCFSIPQREADRGKKRRGKNEERNTTHMYVCKHASQPASHNLTLK